MKINRKPCPNCGKPLLWIRALDRRPLEAEPCMPFPTDPGYALVRRRGRLMFVPSGLLDDPPEHLRVHRCTMWSPRAPRRVSEADMAAVRDGIARLKATA